MRLLAIVGSYRKGKTVDTLIDAAIKGARAGRENVEVEKIHLVDKNVKYCKNCMVCREDDPNKPIAKCVIADDMQTLCAALDEADGFIFGTPVNMGHETAIMKTFLERVCWVLARPGNSPLKGCPEPRTERKKKAIVIVSSGIIPPLLRRWCDEATALLKSVCKCSLNAKVVGSLYAGAVERKGIDAYLRKAFKLGKTLTS
ncbi:flavodoxin family protein [bacterium]|nr:flavodoxin family protein [bacterium]